MPLTEYEAHMLELHGPCKHKENCGNPSMYCNNEAGEPLCIYHLKKRGLADWEYIGSV